MKVLMILIALFLCGTVSQSQTFKISPDSSYPLLHDRQTDNGRFYHRLIPGNYISNGDFQWVHPGDYFMRVFEEPGWEIHGIGEVGIGYLYNWRWGNTVVASLDSFENLAYSYPLALAPGLYLASVDIACRDGHPFSTTQVQIKWNGNVILTYTPSTVQVFTQHFLIKSTGDNTVITFAGAGASDRVGATISNFIVNKVETIQNSISNSDTEYLNSEGFVPYNLFYQYNYIWNGNIELLPLSKNRQDQYYFTGSELGNWMIGEEEGEIGLGKMYSSQWDPETYVIDLDARQNTGYTTFYAGSPYESIEYYLSFDYAPCESCTFETSQISVTQNGQFIFSMIPNTHQIRRQVVKITGKTGNNHVTFRGEGISDGKGLAIDNIEVRRAL